LALKELLTMKLKLSASAALAVLFSSTAAFAQETLEVVSGPTGQRAVTVASYDPLGQSFTAFTDHLTSFGFQFEQMNAGQPNTALTFQLLAGEGLTGTVVATQNFTLPAFSASFTPTWFDIALGDIALDNGQKYTAVLTSTSTLAGVVLGPEINIFTGEVLGTDAYAGGTALFSQESLFHTYPYNNFCATSGLCDMNFRATGYNDVAAGVPEPAAWGMLIGGFGLAGSALRRRKAVRTTVRFA
jgi:hypothetical protein